MTIQNSYCEINEQILADGYATGSTHMHAGCIALGVL